MDENSDENFAIQKPIQKNFQLLSLLKIFWTRFWTQVSEDSNFFLDAVLDDVFLTPFFLDASSDKFWTTVRINFGRQLGSMIHMELEISIDMMFSNVNAHWCEYCALDTPMRAHCFERI